eukprot:NODE_9096_length_663_cov_27.200000_g8832_i0.p1 GENE.NODE_9096_length_663_cov_27.200000_g8832_i0~~NODE_9096_length_663_cov_27.200000_g8832_i0.p1  ORF type:complete len:166 (-),score=62.70 NODE_9096_length_663_cov_27.200000_g8832_i0:166-606(-)
MSPEIQEQVVILRGTAEKPLQWASSIPFELEEVTIPLHEVAWVAKTKDGVAIGMKGEGRVIVKAPDAYEPLQEAVKSFAAQATSMGGAMGDDYGGSDDDDDDEEDEEEEEEEAGDKAPPKGLKRSRKAPKMPKTAGKDAPPECKQQ